MGSQVLRVRPRRIRMMVFVAAPVIVLVFVGISFSLTGTFNETGAAFETPDQVAMILLGVLLAAGSLLLARPSLEADATGVRVRNLFGTTDLPWAVVREVSFRRGAPWVTLDLQDDDLVSVLAIQAADKEHAVKAVRALRALHAAQVPGPASSGLRSAGSAASGVTREDDASRGPGTRASGASASGGVPAGDAPE